MEEKLTLILQSNIKTILAIRGITMSQMKKDLRLTNTLGTRLLSKPHEIKNLNIKILSEICSYLDVDIKDLFSFKDFDSLDLRNQRKIIKH